MLLLTRVPAASLRRPTSRCTRQPAPVVVGCSAPTTTASSTSAATSSTPSRPATTETAMALHDVAEHIVQRLGMEGSHAAMLASTFHTRRTSPTAAVGLQSQPRQGVTHIFEPKPTTSSGKQDGGNTSACTPSSMQPVWSRRQLDKNVDHLQSLFTPPVLHKLLQRLHPDLLGCDLPAWHAFFQGLGFSPDGWHQVLAYSPEAILSNTPFTAGRAIMFLKSMGVTQDEVVSRIIPCYPQLLSMDEGVLEEAASQLVQPGLLEGPESAQRLLLQCPSYLMPSINTQLLPILQRIQNSRDGKYTMSGSYHI